MVPFPQETNFRASLPTGFIAVRRDVPLETKLHDPQSGATKLKAPGHCRITQRRDNLKAGPGQHGPCIEDN